MDNSTKANDPDVGAREIDVTAAMIDAGAEILSFYDPETDRLSNTVTQIFRAMLEVHSSPRP